MEIEEKIQALLNKAGSTSFEEESALFYAKAHRYLTNTENSTYKIKHR